MTVYSQNYLSEPFSSAVAITTNDTTVQPAYRALYVTTAGNLVLRLNRDAADVTLPVTAGQVLTVQAKLIKTASTAVVVGLK